VNDRDLETYLVSWTAHVKEPLTDGEEQVLKVMLQRKSVREMAEALDLSGTLDWRSCSCLPMSG
jgi:hypothetical protein